MNYLSDENIMLSVRNGQIDNMTFLFDRYSTKIYNFFLHFTYNKDLSNDLTQNVFLRLLQYRKTYNENFGFKSWIYQVARNVLTKHYGKEKLKYSSHTWNDQIDWSNCSTEEETLKAEKMACLNSALNKLVPEEKEIILMNRFHGLKYSEIGEITGKSEGAVKAKAHRAMKRLRELYFQII